MADLQQDVRRVEKATRAEIDSSLKTKMIGIVNDANPSLAFKKTDGTTEYITADGGDKVVNSLKIEGLAGNVGIIGVDILGNVVPGEGATLGQVEDLFFDDHQVTATSTGFQYPRTVHMAYDGATSKVTVQPCAVYWRGVKLAQFESAWVSAAHGTIPVNTSQWLYYNGTSFLWAASLPDGFRDMPIARIYRDGVNVCIRECHGFMSAETHEALHYGTGAFLRSGGDLSDFATGSTTATNRRPLISATAVADEDCVTDLPPITLETNAYSQMKMSLASTATITTDNADIVPLLANNPYYYTFTGGVFVETLFPNNAYGKLFVIAIPVTDDPNCQKVRYVFIAPQQVSTTLATIQAVTFSSVSLGQIQESVQEFVPIAEIIIRYAANNWTFTSVTKLSGSLRFQQSAPSSAIPTLSSVLNAGNDAGGLVINNAGNGILATDLATLGQVNDKISKTDTVAQNVVSPLSILKSTTYNTLSGMTFQIGSLNDNAVNNSNAYKWEFADKGLAAGHWLEVGYWERSGVAPTRTAFFHKTEFYTDTPIRIGAATATILATPANAATIETVPSCPVGSLPTSTVAPAITDSIAVVLGKLNTTTSPLVYETVTSISWTKTLPNETGVWRIKGWIAAGSGGGVQFDSNTTNDIGYVRTAVANVGSASRVGCTGGMMEYLDVTISHLLGSLKWYVNGHANASSSSTGDVICGYKTTTGTSTVLSLNNTSSVNLRYSREQ